MYRLLGLLAEGAMPDVRHGSSSFESSEYILRCSEREDGRPRIEWDFARGSGTESSLPRLEWNIEGNLRGGVERNSTEERRLVPRLTDCVPFVRLRFRVNWDISDVGRIRLDAQIFPPSTLQPIYDYDRDSESKWKSKRKRTRMIWATLVHRYYFKRCLQVRRSICSYFLIRTSVIVPTCYESR